MATNRGADAENVSHLSLLRLAFNRAMQSSIDREHDLGLDEDTILGRAREEIAFGQITIEPNGLTPGMHLRLVQPASRIVADWYRTKSTFVTALQPFVKALNRLDELDQEITELRKRKEHVKNSIERQAEAHQYYAEIKKRRDQTEGDFNNLWDHEGRRTPTLGACHWYYWIYLLSIGIAEWLINYDTLFEFFRVVSVAAASAVILGVLLAFAAHGHGTLLKQWTARIGKAVSRHEKWAEYRFFALSTISLSIVVGTAGGLRWAAAMHNLSSNRGINIVGVDALIDIDPTRDVMLSLTANMAAWAVGVYVAYLMHDKNPAYMDAAYEYEKAKAAFAKVRRPVDQDIAIEEARIEQEINAKQRAADAQSRDVDDQRKMRQQIDEHEKSLLDSIVGIVRRNSELYRALIVKQAIEATRPIELLLDGRPITPFEYQKLKIVISPELFRNSSTSN